MQVHSIHKTTCIENGGAHKKSPCFFQSSEKKQFCVVLVLKRRRKGNNVKPEGVAVNEKDDWKRKLQQDGEQYKKPPQINQSKRAHEPKRTQRQSTSNFPEKEGSKHKRISSTTGLRPPSLPPYPRLPFRNPRRRRRRNPRCGAAAAIIAPLDAAAARGRGKAAWHHPLGAALKAQSLSWLPDKRGRAPPAAAERGSSRRRRRAALGVVECGQDLSCQTKIRLIPTLGGVGK